MNILKKLAATLIAFSFLFSLCTNVVHAATPPTEESHAPTEGQTAEEYYNSNEYIDQVEETNRRIDKYIETQQTTRSSSTRNLSVPLIRQEKTWTCSIACLEMVLDYLSTLNLSQNDIISQMEISSSPLLYQVTSYLNSKLGAGTYEHLTIGQYSFSNSLTYSINNNKPLFCLVVPDVLPNYGDTGNGGHYIVVKGYYVAFSGSTSTSVCMYNDPHYSNDHYGTYSCDIDDMVEALGDHSGGGWYIRGAN